MVIGNGASNRAGLVRFEQPLQSVVFIADLILGHLTSCFPPAYRKRRLDATGEPSDFKVTHYQKLRTSRFRFSRKLTLRKWRFGWNADVCDTTERANEMP